MEKERITQELDKRKRLYFKVWKDLQQKIFRFRNAELNDSIQADLKEMDQLLREILAEDVGKLKEIPTQKSTPTVNSELEKRGWILTKNKNTGEIRYVKYDKRGRPIGVEGGPTWNMDVHNIKEELNVQSGKDGSDKGGDKG